VFGLLLTVFCSILSLFKKISIDKFSDSAKETYDRAKNILGIEGMKEFERLYSSTINDTLAKLWVLYLILGIVLIIGGFLFYIIMEIVHKNRQCEFIILNYEISAIEHYLKQKELNDGFDCYMKIENQKYKMEYKLYKVIKK
ncbi:MAG: hypothetical protein ACYDEX_21510, partial [Mobilitalea sp.]